MIELQTLAAVGALDRARERILARRPRVPGSPLALAAVVAAAVLGWVLRGARRRGAG